MAKKYKCTKCNRVYDKDADNCPYCGEKNLLKSVTPIGSSDKAGMKEQNAQKNAPKKNEEQQPSPQKKMLTAAKAKAAQVTSENKKKASAPKPKQMPQKPIEEPVEEPTIDDDFELEEDTEETSLEQDYEDQDETKYEEPEDDDDDEEDYEEDGEDKDEDDVDEEEDDYEEDDEDDEDEDEDYEDEDDDEEDDEEDDELDDEDGASPTELTAEKKRIRIPWKDEVPKPEPDMTKAFNENGVYNPNFDDYYADTKAEIDNELESLFAGREKAILKFVGGIAAVIAIIVYLILTLL